MKNIRIYNAPKYGSGEYALAGTNIYRKTSEDSPYFASIVFEQEPEYDENEPSDSEISQYPLEDILDKFLCSCSDYYEEVNAEDPVNSYIEFESDDIGALKNLLSIVGKHVYNRDDGDSVELVIE